MSAQEKIIKPKLVVLEFAGSWATYVRPAKPWVVAVITADPVYQVHFLG